MKSNKPNIILLVYDGQCPVCSYYSNLIQIKASIGELHLVDARKNSDIKQEVTSLGLDLDQGMILKLNDQLYYGPDAIHMLALIGSQSTFFNKLNYYLFRSKKRSVILYPILKAFRNLLLALRRTSKINNVKTRNKDKNI